MEILNSFLGVLTQINSWMESHAVASNTISILIGAILSAILDIRKSSTKLIQQFNFKKDKKSVIDVQGDLNIEGDLNIGSEPLSSNGQFISKPNLTAEDAYICSNIESFFEKNMQHIDFQNHFDDFIRNINAKEYNVAGGIMLRIINVVLQGKSIPVNNEYKEEMRKLGQLRSELDNLLQDKPVKTKIKEKIDHCRSSLFNLTNLLPL